MLFAIDGSGNPQQVRRVPYQKDFRRWRRGLSEAEYNQIYDELMRRIDGNEIHTSSWMPGSDWTGTVFEPIYAVACNRDEDAAAQFFGLILWQVVMDHPEHWSFGRYEKDGVPIKGMTYFRIV